MDMRPGPDRPVPGRLRVLHGPLNIADQGPALAEAQRRLGVSALSFESAAHPFYPPGDIVAQPRVQGRVARLWIHSVTFMRWARRSDVVHLHAAAFLPPVPFAQPKRVDDIYLGIVVAQLRWLRASGKVLAVSFHGDDVRPISEIRRAWFEADAALALPEYDESLRSSRLRYSAAIAAECDLLYVSTPDLLPFVPGAELLPTVPSRPFARAAGPSRLRTPAGGPLRVVHAPSNPVVKGSDLIVDCIEDLRAAGLPVELRMLKGQPVAEVVAAVREADVLVDQVNLGWYGVLAVEAMSLGIPTLARLDPDYVALFESATGSGLGSGAPISFGSQAELGAVVESLARGELSGELGRLSRDSRSFVHRHHDVDVIAARLVEDYRRVQGRRALPARHEGHG